jgi:hypothetical protein
VQYAAHLTRLVAKTKAYIRELDPTVGTREEKADAQVELLHKKKNQK